VLNIFYQSIELLEIVHKSGYIHCDLKPENLMLGLKGDYKTVYLIDFSLAEKYTDQDGEPLEEPAHSVFKGSISF
jgi:serine/threonine protein kinase